MVQTNKPQSLCIAQDFIQTGLDEAVALSGSMANVLVIDCKKLKTVTVMLRLDDAAIDGDYQVFSTCKESPSTDVTSDEWFAEKASTALTHNVNSKDTFTGNFSFIIVQAKADSGTPTLKAWYKGSN